MLVTGGEDHLGAAALSPSLDRRHLIQLGHRQVFFLASTTHQWMPGDVPCVGQVGFSVHQSGQPGLP